jgi:hypothetical protein
LKSIGTCRFRLKQLFSDFALGPIRNLLSDRLVRDAWSRAGGRYRERLFTPLVTVLCCVFGHLRGGWSLRKVEDWVFSFGRPRSPRHGKALSDARARLPARFLRELIVLLGRVARRRRGLVWHGLGVVLIDGTTLTLERTPGNVARFGRAPNQHRKSCFPVARIVLSLCAGTGAVLRAMVASYGVSEMAMLLRMLPGMEPGTLVLADRYYGSWLVLWRLMQRGCHGLFQIHQARRLLCADWDGDADYIEYWDRPRAVHTRHPWAMKHAPARLAVRIIRRRLPGGRPLILCTTLLDRQRWPAQQVFDLYLLRWKVEIGIRHIKAEHLRGRIQARRAKAAVNEILFGLLAYNAVRCVMADSATEPWRLSHAQSCALILSTADRMREACGVRLLVIYDDMRTAIALTHTAYQTRPPCPRALLPRHERYPLHPDFAYPRKAA